MAKRIVDLMRVPVEDHDLPWLIDSLQAAVQLELSTLPPYLCGLWSIESASGAAYDLINSIILEEMLHMGWACNILNSLNTVPEIVTGYQQLVYPGPLPGGVRPQLTVTLAGLTPDQIFNVYMQIEYPESPVAIAAVAAGETYPTIGAFYDAILAAFDQLNPPLSGNNQLTATFTLNGQPYNQLTAINTAADVTTAISTIKQQGEGTSASPDSIDPGSEFAHYYKFKEIYTGKTLIQVNGQWQFDGDPVPFPDAYPMTEIPTGGYQNPSPAVQSALVNFNTQFSSLLDQLQSAWATGSSTTLGDAVGTMFKLPSLAVALMKMPLPDGSGVYGPDFVYMES